VHHTDIYPPQGGEVGGLGHVEAVVESRMVRRRECDHELSRQVHGLPNNDNAQRSATVRQIELARRLNQ
jgi:hypothetical protein